jgi:hypothetical protein
MVNYGDATPSSDEKSGFSLLSRVNINGVPEFCLDSVKGYADGI